MKALVILNPVAGHIDADALRDALQRLFSAAGIAYEVYQTRPGDEPGEIVRDRLGKGFDLMVAAGGDGTISAVLDGLTGSQVPLGIVPVGTGNLVARELGIPIDAEQALALIAGPHAERRIDTMRIGKRVYVLNVSVGVSASVAGDMTYQGKGRFGRLAYVGSAIFRILQFRRRYLTVGVDGQERRCRAVEITVMNCAIFGKGLYPKEPIIRVDDGCIDVWIVSMRTLFDGVKYFLKILTGRSAPRMAQHAHARKRVAIRGALSCPVQADGDIIGTTPVEIEVLPHALTVIVPVTPGDQACQRA